MNTTIAGGLRLLLVMLIIFSSSGCARRSVRHEYAASAPGPLLTESMAVRFATETLIREGYDPELWRITRADNPPTKAPDGTPDRFLVRYQPNYGRIYFSSGQKTIAYDVSCDGTKVYCSRFRGL